MTKSTRTGAEFVASRLTAPKRREKRIAGKWACLQCDGIYDDRETTATVSGYCSKRCQKAMGE